VANRHQAHRLVVDVGTVVGEHGQLWDIRHTIHTLDIMTTTTTATATPTLDELRSGPPTISIEQAAQYLGVSRG
jgi:hypothetical protein